jgi:O-antigen/teichoic acid export membrane protein
MPTEISGSEDQAGQSGLRRVAQNTAVLIAMRVGLPAISLILVFALSRLLGAEGLGRYSLVFSVLFFFNTVTPLGLGAIITREGARDPSTLEATVPHAMVLGLLASLPMTLLMAWLGSILDYDAKTSLDLKILSLVVFPCTAGLFYESAFIALQRIEYVAAGMLIDHGIKVGGGMVALFLGWGLEWVLAMSVLSRVLSWAASAAMLRRCGIRLRWRYDGKVLRELASTAPTFMLISIFATLYWRIDTYMLSKLQPMDQVGFYSAAYRILDLAIVVPNSLCLAVYPHMIALIANDARQLKELSARMTRYFLAMGLPMGVCSMIVGDGVLRLLYGASFGVAANTLSVLMWTLFVYGFMRYNAYLLVASDRQNVDLAFNFLMMLINIGLNAVLIPRYSHLGAAIATFVAICIYAGVQYVYLGLRLPHRAARIFLDYDVLLATGACALAAIALRGAGVVVAVGGGMVVYGVVLLARGFFTPAELRLVRLDRLAPVMRWAQDKRRE